MSKSEYHVPNLERALQILNVLSDNPKGLTQKELIDSLGISKNSIYRITMTLQAYGYIGRDEVSRRYFLTRKMMMVGASAMGDHNLVSKSIVEMQELRDKVNASVYLAVLEGDEGVILEQAIGGAPFKFSVDLGSRFKLYSGAPGKAMLAFLPEDESEEILARTRLVRHNERTICTKKELREEFIRIRECGYAVDRAEEFEGCHCVGTVIRDYNGYPIAMIWASAPSVSLTESRFAEVGKLIKNTAGKISEKFGFGLCSK